jgi:hypothetical protein
VAGSDLWILEGVTSSNTPPTRALAPTLHDVRLTHSGDRGSTLDLAVSAPDPNAGPKFMRAMATLEPDRTLSLVYYAGAKDNDNDATVRRSRSTDSGKTFTPSDWLGDLLGVTSDARNTFAANRRQSKRRRARSILPRGPLMNRIGRSRRSTW